MGNTQSCSSKGSMLLVAVANGDITLAQEIIKKEPKAAMYHNFPDRNSPLLQAAARGHFELLQLILETAVMTEGPEKAKRQCIDHTNSKRQTPLMVACKHGHPECVEYLITNGADPLVTDERRKNTCLHFAALYGRSECVQKLLGSRASYSVQGGRQVPIAQIPCHSETTLIGTGTTSKFIDHHNGWGLSALHLAVFQGSASTVRVLLRHGAALDSLVVAAKVENSPVRCAVGSNALHIAAYMGNVVMAKLLLEAQENYIGLDLRRQTNEHGLKPLDYARRARSPVLVHLLDERLPIMLLRQIWINYSLDQSMPPRYQTLAALLQKLNLMFNLELIAIQHNINVQGQASSAAGDGAASVPNTSVAPPSSTPSCAAPSSSVSLSPAKGKNKLALDSAGQTLHWSHRLEEVQNLLRSVNTQVKTLGVLCKKPEEAEEHEGNATWMGSSRYTPNEATLDFILSSLITPRTVSAIVHAAKNLVCSSISVATGGNPPSDSETAHSMALLSTALRAIETCLEAGMSLTANNAVDVNAPAATLVPEPVEGTETPLGSQATLAATRPPMLGPSQLNATSPAYSSHWTAHLNTLISQLQWDIGVQRHRRRRHHAAQAATAAAGNNQQTENTATSRTARAGPEARGPSVVPEGPAITGPPTAIPDGAGREDVSDNRQLGASGTLVSINLPSRRGDALQEALCSTGGIASTGDQTAQLEAGDENLQPLLSAVEDMAPGAVGPPGPVVRGQQEEHGEIISTVPELEGAEGLVDEAQWQARWRPVQRMYADPAYIQPLVLGGRPRPSDAGAFNVDNPERGQADSEAALDNDTVPSKCSFLASCKQKQDKAVEPEDGNGDDDSIVCSAWSDDDVNVCSICMDLPVAVLISGCHHGLCVQCAFQLCAKGRDLPSCPFCRQKIGGFEAKALGAAL